MHRCGPEERSAAAMRKSIWKATCMENVHAWFGEERMKKGRVIGTSSAAYSTALPYIGLPKMEVSAPFLDQWVQQCKQWLTQDLTLYVLCHCPCEEHSPDICLELYKRLTKVISLPALPWLEEKSDTEPEQGYLF